MDVGSRSVRFVGSLTVVTCTATPLPSGKGSRNDLKSFAVHVDVMGGLVAEVFDPKTVAVMVLSIASFMKTYFLQYEVLEAQLPFGCSSKRVQACFSRLNAISPLCATFLRRPGVQRVSSSFWRLRQQRAYQRRDLKKHPSVDWLASLRGLQSVPRFLPRPVLPQIDPYILC